MIRAFSKGCIPAFLAVMILGFADGLTAQQIRDHRDGDEPRVRDHRTEQSEARDQRGKSETRAGYRRLRALLRADRWQRARDQTWELMLRVGDRNGDRMLNYSENDSFPCRDLRLLMNLWREHFRASSGFDDILIPRFKTRAVSCEIWLR